MDFTSPSILVLVSRVDGSLKMRLDFLLALLEEGSSGWNSTSKSREVRNFMHL